jgi:hypothetical protein
MTAEKDIKYLEERIKRFYNDKEEDKYIVSVFEHYLDYLKRNSYTEYFIKANGESNIPNEMKKEKRN